MAVIDKIQGIQHYDLCHENMFEIKVDVENEPQETIIIYFLIHVWTLAEGYKFIALKHDKVQILHLSTYNKIAVIDSLPGRARNHQGQSMDDHRCRA